MGNPLDDFLESELEGSGSRTINQIVDSISRSRIYDALERLLAAGKVERARIGKEHTYRKITPIIPGAVRRFNHANRT